MTTRIIIITLLTALVVFEVLLFDAYLKSRSRGSNSRKPKDNMLLVKSFVEVVYAVYGDRWHTFSTSKQEDILRMLDYWRQHGELNIHSGPAPEDVIIALDDAFNAEYGMGYNEILNGPRGWHYVKNRYYMYKILSQKCGLSPTVISRILMKPQTRASIWHALNKFDDLYQYDVDFRNCYDRILQLTDESLKGCEKEPLV